MKYEYEIRIFLIAYFCKSTHFLRLTLEISVTEAMVLQHDSREWNVSIEKRRRGKILYLTQLC